MSEFSRRRICGICNGLLQDRAKPLQYHIRLRVWCCTECHPILDTIPDRPKETSDACQEAR